MNQTELLNRAEAIFANCLETLRAKNADYTGDREAFANFTIVEHTYRVCPTEIGMFVRIMDKVSRLATLLKNPAHVMNESIKDTLLDLINYFTLMYIYLDSKEKES